MKSDWEKGTKALKRKRTAQWRHLTSGCGSLNITDTLHYPCRNVLKWICVYGMSGACTGHGATQKDRGKSISPCPGINAANLPDSQLNPPPICLFFVVPMLLGVETHTSLPEGGGCRCVINKTCCSNGIDEVAYGGRIGEDVREQTQGM